MTSLLVENGRALESRLDFSGPWRVLKANWWKVVLFAAVVTLVAVPFILSMPPREFNFEVRHSPMPPDGTLRIP
ncbi:hypothetical protein [Aeromonas veronii]|uniref:hypothetical protein n=1 Tax=Aeromonas veronii TaxID=654 RepID=UPI00214DEABF|nr:hypothetical protein [Aeromonas veronii]MCR3967433.1 hypothetical protein [Aeromonas veronii]MCR3979909.1 hypothetical protein [Aeromonas veronii]